MLRLALFFLVISLAAALLAFSDAAVATAQTARLLFFVTFVTFLAMVATRLLTGGTLL